MNASDYIINVSEADFEYEVLGYSQNIPVVVDFWATWCGPCKVLGPMLERLAEEGHGAFRLAKLDVDANPNLAIRYGVHSIPSVKAFRAGQVVSELTGLQPEPRLREFLRQLAPSPSDLLLEKGSSMLVMHQWASAEQAFRQALEMAPERPLALLGLVKSLLAQGRSEEAGAILHKFPASREYNSAELLMPLTDALNQVKSNSLPQDDPLSAAYRNSLRLVTRGNIPAALDGLLDILRQDKRYLNGRARQVILGLLELLGEQDLQTREYRTELAMILF